MHNVRTRHVRRLSRRPRRGGPLVVAAVGLAAVVWLGQPASTPRVAGDPVAADADRLRRELVADPPAVDPRAVLARAADRAGRWSATLPLALQYRVRPDLAALIRDVAREERIDPDLGFRLVRVESEFNPRATSPVGAIGLAQVMPATARYYEKDITREELYEPRTNLRIGFRYLRGLVREHRGDLRLALLSYNRGPGTVAAVRRRGEDPSNGYDELVLRGYAGSGVIP
jgi:soluble lytic murein transglycosylase-like protein